MNPRIVRIDILLVELPFRFSFAHALATRRASRNVLIRAELDTGTVGFGEGIPREYVTGESPETAFDAVRKRLAPALLGCQLTTPDELDETLTEAAEATFLPTPFALNAARCGLELALLDALGKHLDLPVRTLFSDGTDESILCYDAVFPFLPRSALVPAAIAVRALGIRRVKLKVGRALPRDLRALKTLRRVLGHSADVRVDANAAWSSDEAIASISAMRRYRLSAVEQPLPAENLDGLQRLTSAVPEMIIVDESLRTESEAEELGRRRACGAFNIRVSKCGGLARALRIAAIGRKYGMDLVVGAQVGESAILSAAGRELGAMIRPRYLEGSAGRILLRADVSRESLLPGRGGRVLPNRAPGFGIAVDEGRLLRLARRRETLAAKGVRAR